VHKHRAPSPRAFSIVQIGTTRSGYLPRAMDHSASTALNSPLRVDPSARDCTWLCSCGLGSRMYTQQSDVVGNIALC
jgi:hypothetical protein